MPQKRKVVSKASKKKGRRTVNDATTGISDQLRAGMPAKDSVRKVVEFVSPQHVRYKILKTTERDAYDAIAKAPKRRRPS
jgi:hypothetical protein